MGLNMTEFGILEFLMKTLIRSLPATRYIGKYGMRMPTTAKTVTVHIRRIREKNRNKP